MQTKNMGKLPPQAIEVEEAVLGAILLEKQAIEMVAGILSPADFYRNENQLIYEAIENLHKERAPIDMLTVTDRLQKTDKLEACGGPFYIATITSKVASSAHVEFHARIIKEKSIKRQAGTVGSAIWNEAYDDTEDVWNVLMRAAKNIDALTEIFLGKSESKHISEIVHNSLTHMHTRVERFMKEGLLGGIDTGFRQLNEITNGWQNSDLVILASRPGMGKTAMMLHFAKQAAKLGVPVSIFSLEMENTSIGNRFILSECEIKPEKFRAGQLEDEEIQKIEQAAYNLSMLPIYVDDNPCVSMQYIRNRCRLLKKQGKCGMIIADYLQLAIVDEKQVVREQEVAKMSRLAKIIAKELDVPFLLLSQLNRNCETRADKRPILSDLRESGSIEQDADMVLFIHRPIYYNIVIRDPDTNNPLINYGELIIAKNREGRTDTVTFHYNEGMTKFY